jgi:HPt (histidine-containing phosphotransfer) domain-containing protein
LFYDLSVKDLPPEVVKDLQDLFLSDTPDRLHAMLTALQENDAVALGRAAHALKGSALVMELDQIATLCEKLELECRQGMPPGARAAVEAVSREVDAVRVQWSL